VFVKIMGEKRCDYYTHKKRYNCREKNFDYTKC